MKSQKLTVLKGEGSNIHTIYGNIIHSEVMDYMQLDVKDSILKHEKPNGQFSNEHNALQLPDGKLVTGKQVEYNPFKQEISRVWD